MIKRINKHLEMRPLRVEDKQEFINMKVKSRDEDELHRFIGIDIEDYLKWHYEILFEGTHVFIYKGKMIGVVGITDENLYFFTDEVDKLCKFCIVKYLKEVLDDLMDEAGVKKVHAFLDAQYIISKEWALRGGFKVSKTVDIQGNPFDIIIYCRQDDGNERR